MNWTEHILSYTNYCILGKHFSYTNNYYILTRFHVWNLKKWYWWTYLQSSNGDTDIENRIMDMTQGSGGGEGGRHGESNMETYIAICKVDSKWEFAVWQRELKPRLGNKLDGWAGEGCGRDVQVQKTWVNLWLIHVDVW